MNEKLSQFHATILIYMIQVGVVLFSLSQLTAQHFGTNGWLSLIIFCLIASFNIFLISVVHRLGNGRSIFTILEQSIPKFLLYPIYLAFICTWAMLGSLVAKQYLLIFQLVAFPTSNPMIFKLILDILVFSLVVKGVYNIAKASAVFFWLVVWMNLLLFFFYGNFKWARLTPFIFQDAENMVKGLFDIYPAFLGYELCLLLFSYTDKKTKLIKATYVGNVITTISYMYVGLIAYGFYGMHQLKLMLYPLIDLLAYIKFPFIERIENLFYGFFMFTTIITTVMYLWSATEVSRRIFPKVKEKVLGFVIVFSAYFASFLPEILSEVQVWLSKLALIEAGIAFGLPVVLILILLFQRMRGESISG
jgi:spore germination protein (amino acid permease)